MTRSGSCVCLARALLAFSVIFGSVHLVLVAWGAKQRDFRTYFHAAKAHMQGLNPYDLESVRRVSGIREIRLPYVYPPHCADLLGPLTHLQYRHAYYVYLFLRLSAVAGLVATWIAIVPASRRDRWALYVTVLLGYRYAFLRDLKAGNVSTFEQFLFWGGILLAMCHRSVLGGLGILLSSIFKLVTMALLPAVVVIRRSWQSLASTLVLGVSGLAAYVMLYLANRPMWTRFLEEVRKLDERGGNNPSSLAYLRDVRDAFQLGDSLVPVVYGGLCCIVLLCLAWAFWATRRSRDAYPMLYLLILGYVILAPRMKDYSLMIALLPTLHTISAMAERRWLAILGAVLLWVPMVGYQSLVVSSFAFCLVLRWVWNYGGDPDKRVEPILDPLHDFRQDHRPLFRRAPSSTTDPGCEEGHRPQEDLQRNRISRPDPIAQTLLPLPPWKRFFRPVPAGGCQYRQESDF